MIARKRKFNFTKKKERSELFGKARDKASSSLENKLEYDLATDKIFVRKGYKLTLADKIKMKSDVAKEPKKLTKTSSGFKLKNKVKSKSKSGTTLKQKLTPKEVKNPRKRYGR